MNKIDFDKNDGLVPAVIQDADTNKVLMLGYMNSQAVDQTNKTGKVTFFSRSRKSLWVKGESSGNYLNLVSMDVDCDGDALLVKAIPVGPTCHTGAATCWNETNQDELGFLRKLNTIVSDRMEMPVEDSYTSRMFQQGLKKMGQKVGEEGVEVALEAELGTDIDLLNESADLIFHLLILLKARDLALIDVVEVLKLRNH